MENNVYMSLEHYNELIKAKLQLEAIKRLYDESMNDEERLVKVVYCEDISKVTGWIYEKKRSLYDGNGYAE